MKRRILYIIDSLKVGGAETLLIDLLDAAASRGEETHVAYFSPGPLAPEVVGRTSGATRLSRSGIKDPRALLRALRLIRRWKPDVVHTHLTKSDLIGQVAARLSNVPRRVVTLHNTDPWRRNRLLSSLYRMLTSTAHVHVAVSDQVANFVAECGGAPPSRLKVISNGVDLKRFDEKATKPLDLSQWGVPGDRVIVAVIGRLAPQKDLPTFLKAAAMVAGRNSKVHFVLAGDGELRQSLEHQARALGLTPERLSFTGIVRDIPGLLAAVDIVALSSAWEGLPMIVLEAMAMGRPIAATRVGGIPNAIEDGQNGLLVAPGDPAALADAIERLARDPDLRKEIGQAGRETVEKRFSGKAMLDRLIATYDTEEAAKCAQS